MIEKTKFNKWLHLLKWWHDWRATVWHARTVAALELHSIAGESTATGAAVMRDWHAEKFGQLRFLLQPPKLLRNADFDEIVRNTRAPWRM